MAMLAAWLDPLPSSRPVSPWAGGRKVQLQSWAHGPVLHLLSLFPPEKATCSCLLPWPVLSPRSRDAPSLCPVQGHGTAVMPVQLLVEEGPKIGERSSWLCKWSSSTWPGDSHLEVTAGHERQKPSHYFLGWGWREGKELKLLKCHIAN